MLATGVNVLCVKTVGDSRICVKTALIMFEELNAEIAWRKETLLS